MHHNVFHHLCYVAAVVVDWVHYVISSFGSWVAWSLETLIIFPIRWTFETLILFPIRWVYETVSVCMKPLWKHIRKCLEIFTGPRTRHFIPPLKNGWLEKEVFLDCDIILVPSLHTNSTRALFLS
jgi:hypothetical protein